MPDVFFLFYLISPKVGGTAYNLLHHRGLAAALTILGLYTHNNWLAQLGFVFLAHSSFDRTLGYGLKHFDSFKHTHLGWIGKKQE